MGTILHRNKSCSMASIVWVNVMLLNPLNVIRELSTVSNNLPSAAQGSKIEAL